MALIDRTTGRLTIRLHRRVPRPPVSDRTLCVLVLGGVLLFLLYLGWVAR